MIFVPECYVVSIDCSMTFTPYYTRSSYHDCVKVNGNGNLDVNTAETFYGSCRLTKTSSFNNLWIAFLNYDSSLSYKCYATAKYVGCECGWTMVSKISAGTAPPLNKYPCMARITNSGQTFSGGTISKYFSS